MKIFMLETKVQQIEVLYKKGRVDVRILCWSQVYLIRHYKSLAISFI
jgi:hypothetical protein